MRFAVPVLTVFSAIGLVVGVNNPPVRDSDGCCSPADAIYSCQSQPVNGQNKYALIFTTPADGISCSCDETLCFPKFVNSNGLLKAPAGNPITNGFQSTEVVAQAGFCGVPPPSPLPTNLDGDAEYQTCTNPDNTVTLVGDPHISLFNGQQLEFVGIPGQVFNLITEAHHLVNARFDTLADVDSTFITAVGVRYGAVDKVSIVPSGDGLEVKVNGRVLAVREKVEVQNSELSGTLVVAYSMDFDGLHFATVKTPLLQVTAKRPVHAEHLDMLISVKETRIMHGIVGHSVQGEFEGEESSYMTSGLFNDDFKYNMYLANATAPAA